MRAMRGPIGRNSLNSRGKGSSSLGIWVPSIAPTMFGSRDKSSNVPIEAVVSVPVCGKCIYSSFSSNKAATTSWTASITVDLPTLNTGPMLTYELPCASLYIPRAKTFSGGMQSLNRGDANQGLKGPSLHSQLASKVRNLLECFYRRNVFQTMSLPDAVKSTTKVAFVNDVYSNKPYVF